jgi:hypothetical protein
MHSGGGAVPAHPSCSPAVELRTSIVAPMMASPPTSPIVLFVTVLPMVPFRWMPSR